MTGDDPGMTAEGWFNLLAFLSADCLLTSWPELGLPLPEGIGRRVSAAAKEALANWIGRAANIRQFSWSPSAASAAAEDFLGRVESKLDRPAHAKLLKWMSFFFLSEGGRRDVLDQWAFHLAFIQAQSAAAVAERETTDIWTSKVARVPLVNVVPSLLAAQSQWDRYLVGFSDNAADFAATIEGYARRMRLVEWWREEVASCFERARLIEILASTGMPIEVIGRDADLLEMLDLSGGSG